MNVWAKVPVFRLLLPLIAGLLLAGYLPFLTLSAKIGLSFFFFLLFLGLKSLYLRIPYHARWLAGVPFFISVVFAGLCLHTLAKSDLRPGFVGKYLYPNSFVVVRLTEPPAEKENSWKLTAEAEKVLHHGKEALTHGTVLLYLPKDSQSAALQYGDVLLIKNRLQAVPPPRNPDVFNYKAYLASQDIHLQAYLRAEEWSAADNWRRVPLWVNIYAVRAHLKGLIKAEVDDPSAAAIAQALFLGDRSELSTEVKDAFAGTGTMHVLAVSGLHVGILFLILNILFSPAKRNEYGRWLSFAIIILCIWGYAFLTGLSPSVLRAAVMFSFLQAGIGLGRLTNIYNTLSIAAFLLLLADPLLLSQLGFQFSFLALLGIIWLQPYFASWLHLKNPVLKYGWQLLTASLAAQLTTFPLALLYFQQFPLWFLVSNLLVVPAVFVVFSAGCVFIFLSLLNTGWLTMGAGKLLSWLITALHLLVGWLGALPYATWQDVYITPLLCLLLYLLIAFISFAFIHRSKYSIWISSALALVFLLLAGWYRYQSYTHPRMDVYALNKGFAMSMQHNDSLYVLADSAFLEDPQNLRYNLYPHSSAMYIPRSHIRYVNIEEEACSIRGSSFCYSRGQGWYGGRRFLLLTSGRQLSSLPVGAACDWVILTSGLYLNVDELREKVKFKELIACGDNAPKALAKWESQCKALGIGFHNLRKDNSFAWIATESVNKTE